MAAAASASVPMMIASLVALLLTVSPAPGDGAGERATRERLDRAMASAPQTSAEWTALGRLFHEARRYRDAVASFERAMQLDSSISTEAAKNIVRSYERLGNKKQAARWREQAQLLRAISSASTNGRRLHSPTAASSQTTAPFMVGRASEDSPIHF